MAYSLMSFMLEGRGKDGIKMMLEGEIPVQYKVNIPIVLLGGPVKAYYEELKSLIDADIIVPEQARVGNAVGALVGKGIKRIEITIRPIQWKIRIRISLYLLRLEGKNLNSIEWPWNILTRPEKNSFWTQ